MATVEDALRAEVARTWRQCGELGLTDTIFNHISVRLREDSATFLMNRCDRLAVKATAADLNRIEDNESSGQTVVQAGVLLHRSIYEHRPEVNAIIHVHSAAATAVSTLRCGLLPLTQTAMEFMGDVAYVDFAGVVDNQAEGDRLAACLGSRSTALLQNHGLVAVGSSLAEAFYLCYYLEQACEYQLRILASGMEYLIPCEEVCQTAAEQLRAQRATFAPVMWAAMCGASEPFSF
jgi:ribulose-5-phosphate 4-epimerase/fuculose-1-phosphate aldolase